MKTLLFLAAVFYGLNLYPQSYFITFKGIGASSSVSSVTVENLNKGTSIIMDGKAVLCLTYATSAGYLTINQSHLKLYPNPATESATLEFVAPVSGVAEISIINMTGVTLASTGLFLQNSIHRFQITGFPQGMYIINIEGRDYQYSGRFVSNNTAIGKPVIRKIIEASAGYYPDPKLRGVEKTFADTIVMEYDRGDRMMFTGISGDYSTVVIDIPDSDKVMQFEFVPCRDIDGNKYKVVKINNNYWTAENLKTSRYNDGIPIMHVTDDEIWEKSDWEARGIYCYYDDDTLERERYGNLYNWWAVALDKKRGLCPDDWHIVNSIEFFEVIKLYEPEVFVLEEVLKAGAALKETGTNHWLNPNTAATNESGYTAIPGGYRGETFSGKGSLGSWWLGYGEGFSLYNNSIKVFYWWDRYDGGHSVRCARDFVSTSPIESINLTTAISGGNVYNEGGSSVQRKGVCWDTSEYDISLKDQHTNNGSGPGPFSSRMTGLKPGTQYFVRAYAINHEDTLFGKVRSFNTSVADVDGNIYKTVTIGNQTWLAENLRTTKFNDGTPLIYVPDNAQWESLYISETRPAYCWLFNNPANKDIYGAIYDFRALGDWRLEAEDHKKNLCPVGWHVPLGSEWFQLILTVDPDAVDRQGPVSDTAGIFLSESGYEHWKVDNNPATNETGFTNLPGGARMQNGDFINDRGYYSDKGASGTWSIWTKQVGFVHGHPGKGYSVRCIKDK